MTTYQYRFPYGLDLRHDAADSDPRSVRIATNLDLRANGKYFTRGALSKICEVSAESVGLYSFNGALHAVVPGGQGLQDERPAEVVYDPIGPYVGLDEDGEPNEPEAYDLGTLARLRALEVIGSADVVGGFPYVVLEKSDGTFEHHWLTETVADADDPVETGVSLPFDPGPTLAKIEGKLTADDPSNGVLRFNSTTGGPRDWSTVRDAGFLAVSQHAAGARQITGQGIFNKRLAILFEDSIQIWNMAADPSNITLENTLTGPGTKLNASGAVENVLGDLIYSSQGGFRSLSVVDLAGQTREGDIGSFIQTETDDLDMDNNWVTGFWSQSRSQYICAVGSDVYVFTNAVISKTRGWTKWSLPVTIHYICEHAGDVYIRSGNVIYKLDATLEEDDVAGGTDIEWQLRTQFLDGKTPGVRKHWKFMNLVMTGAAQVNFYYDSRDTDELVITGPYLENTTYQAGLTPIMCMSEHLAVEFVGTGRWELDAVNLTFDVLRGGV